MLFLHSLQLACIILRMRCPKSEVVFQVNLWHCLAMEKDFFSCLEGCLFFYASWCTVCSLCNSLMSFSYHTRSITLDLHLLIWYFCSFSSQICVIFPDCFSDLSRWFWILILVFLQTLFFFPSFARKIILLLQLVCATRTRLEADHPMLFRKRLLNTAHCCVQFSNNLRIWSVIERSRLHFCNFQVIYMYEIVYY